jgi:1-deoxy-D-xylulose-5-phosphate reductoisomerase
MVTRVTILGATGSIGRSTLDVIAENPDLFTVEAVVSGRDAAGLTRIALDYGAKFAAVMDDGQGAALEEALSGSGIHNGAGLSAVLEAASRDTDIVVSAITGAAGLEPTFAALRPGVTIALANKETLVCAGEAVMARAQEVGATIVPLDSEHNALHQALANHPLAHVLRMTVTASGGPFRTWAASRIATATRAQALAHPNWSMGSKITIDSATWMNKGLELIEAKHLFGLRPDQLDVIVHPQSIIHGLVTFRDGSVSAGMACHDMRVAVAHCLGRGHRLDAPPSRHLDLAQIGALTFEKPDLERFPCLALAQAALAEGGAVPAILNAANEVAVAAFLAEGIAFPTIASLVEATMTKLSGRFTKAATSVEEALAVDHVARSCAVELLSNGALPVT